MLYAGVDTHKRYSRVVVAGSNGNKVAQAPLENNLVAFSDFFSHLDQPTKAVLEAGRPWGVIYDLLEEIGVELVLANPLKTRAIAEAKIKADSIDARTLADLLRARRFKLSSVSDAQIVQFSIKTDLKFHVL